jgi:toxin ParE1/3/4
VSDIAWAVDLSITAERDFTKAIEKSVEKFGPRQGAIYREALLAAIAALRDGPSVPGSIGHDEVRPGLRVLHVARGGRKGRHFIVYRATGETTIRVVRILHDAMDIARHVVAG